jgi:hypothetical protein
MTAKVLKLYSIQSWESGKLKEGALSKLTLEERRILGL